MSDVERLCNIRSAVVDNDSVGVLVLRNAEMLVSRNILYNGKHIFVRKSEIEKARLYNLCLCESIVCRKNSRNLVSYHKRSFPVKLRTLKSTVALELAKIKTVGSRNSTESLVITALFKSSGNLFGKNLSYSLHKKLSFQIILIT